MPPSRRNRRRGGGRRAAAAGGPPRTRRSAWCSATAPRRARTGWPAKSPGCSTAAACGTATRGGSAGRCRATWPSCSARARRTASSRRRWRRGAFPPASTRGWGSSTPTKSRTAAPCCGFSPTPPPSCGRRRCSGRAWWASRTTRWPSCPAVSPKRSVPGRPMRCCSGWIRSTATFWCACGPSRPAGWPPPTGCPPPSSSTASSPTAPTRSSCRGRAWCRRART